MQRIKIVVIDSLQKIIENSDARTRKLFEKQKRFMELKPYYNSLGRTKLRNVTDQYGNSLWEIRLDGKRRIVFVEKIESNEIKIIWLKICSHDELIRNDIIRINGSY